MRYSGIGGQAVMEGVMMKNQEKYAVAVRKPDGEIALEVSEYKGIIKNKKIRNMPVLRGVFSFIESLYLGVATLTFSASFFEEEETDQKEKTKKQREKKVLTEEQQKRQDSLMMGGTVAFSIVLAVAIFMILPYYISVFFQKFTDSYMLIAVLEGLIRLAIFIGYVAGKKISLSALFLIIDGVLFLQWGLLVKRRKRKLEMPIQGEAERMDAIRKKIDELDND